ncbi:hypothetical protein B0H13DRAFT_2303309 [Mycena leptocephala]|nr:hypothetical protein B0H13DRAFT_2303309 [Mycena leptocephala]
MRGICGGGGFSEDCNTCEDAGNELLDLANSFSSGGLLVDDQMLQPYQTVAVRVDRDRSRRLVDLVAHKRFIIKLGSKITHSHEIKHSSSIYYAEMLFFDDLKKNSNIESQVGKDGLDQGLDWDTYKRGLKRFARNHKDYVYDDKDDDDDD